MKKKFLAGLAIGLLAIGMSGAPVWATVLDWTTGYASPDGSNLGLTYSPNVDLTVTAKSNLGDLDDPLWVGDPGTVGTVFWGKLGELDTKTDPKTTFYGLGVQNAKLDKQGNLDPGGSKGISGGGGDANESLIFSFANPPGVDVNSVKLSLIGLNGGKNADVIDLFLEFTPLESPSDYHYTSIAIGSDTTYLLDFSTLGLTGDFGSFAITAVDGHFGVGGIDYTVNTTAAPVPEPATMLLMGTGLTGLIMARRKKAKKN